MALKAFDHPKAGSSIPRPLSCMLNSYIPFHTGKQSLESRKFTLFVPGNAHGTKWDVRLSAVEKAQYVLHPLLRKFHLGSIPPVTKVD